LPPKAAANLAVVANELITNALKHGAPGADGQLIVEVALAQHGETLRLRVRNSGTPVPSGFDPRTQRGLGLRLVHGLVTEQYQGAFRVFSEPAGSLAEVIAPLSSLRQL
jgi:two-component sensor histidine kinase